MIKDCSTANMPKIKEFLKFHINRCNTLRVLNQGKVKSATSKPNEKKKTEKKVVLATMMQECKFCKGSHSIYKYEELLGLSVANRKKEIIAKKLCVNCLGAAHFAKSCKSTSCKKCAMRHNTLLHMDTKPQAKNDSAIEVTPVVSYCMDGSALNLKSPMNIEDDEGLMNICYAQQPTSNVILSMTRVNAYDKDGNPQVCRVLLDSGSQSNLITKRFAKKLKLLAKAEQRSINGINQARTNARKITEVRIQSIHEDFAINLECLILPSITEQLPHSQINVKRILIPKNLHLVDPEFDKH